MPLRTRLQKCTERHTSEKYAIAIENRVTGDRRESMLLWDRRRVQ